MIDITIGGPEKSDLPQEQQQNEFQSEKISQVAREQSGLFPIAVFGGLLLVYCLAAVMSINAKYVDFGDGNYLYLSWRLVEGDVLYQDLPSPQPPLLLFLGSFLLWLGDGDSILIRLWQVFQHALTACCIYGITHRIFNLKAISALAGSIYLFLPEGVWWAAGYQSEPLLILLQCVNLMLLLTALQRDKPSMALYLAGMMSAICCFVNMTALPYVVLQWFFIGIHFRAFFWRYSASLVLPGMMLFGGMLMYSSGQYVEHIFFRQVGTYPADSLREALSYFVYKLYTDGGDIIFFEGGFVFAGLIGVLLFAANNDRLRVKDYLIWWAVFSMGSIIFVTKGGTVEYIFTLGEPAVAVFSAYFIYTFCLATDLTLSPKKWFSCWREFGKITLIVCLLLPALMMKPFSLLYRTLSNGPLPITYETGVFELPSDQMLYLKNYIQRICPEEKEMIAPPYYAFIGKRKLSQNSSSLFILSLAYLNEWDRYQENETVAIDLPGRREISRKDYFSNSGDYYDAQSIFQLSRAFDESERLRKEYPAIDLFLQMRKDIMERKVGLVIKNQSHSFFTIPPLHQAIRDFCVEETLSIELENREERLQFFRPE